MISIAIIIPVYNRKNVTIAGLKNLTQALIFYKERSSNKLHLNIIVVDDGSTDGTGEWIKIHMPKIIYLEGNGNLWWSGSINMGAKHAIEILNSTHVLLWNDDTSCSTDYFYNLEITLTEQPDLSHSILVSKIFWIDNKNLLFNFGCYFNSKNGRKTLIGLNKKDTFNDILKVDWSGGMGTLIPKNIMVKLNYLNDRYFPQYDGDIDFFLRAKEMQYFAYAIPNLIIYNNPETTGIHSKQKLINLPAIITSNRSLFNFKKNVAFNLRHSNTFLSWVFLFKEYISMITKLKIR
jgi:GT2 family glycosyltransferase